MTVDSALIRGGSGIAANYRSGALPAPQCRQSRRVADRAIFVPLHRPVASPTGSWNHDPRFCADDGRVPTSQEPTLGAFRQDTNSRSRRRSRGGVCDRAGWDGRAAGADLSVAGRDGGADRARDASRIFCAVIRGNSCIPCGDCRHPWPHLGGRGHPCALRSARWLCREADRRPHRQRRLCHFGDRVAHRRRALYGGRR